MDEQKQITTLDALKIFVNTQRALDRHVAENRQVFNTYEVLGKANHKARNDAEDAAATTGQGAEYEGYTLVIKPQTQTYIDAELLRQFAGQPITDAIIQSATRTVARAPHIVIRKDENSV